MTRFYLLLVVLFVSYSVSSAQKIELINSGDLIRQANARSDSGNYKGALKLLNKISRNDTNYVWSLYERALNYQADSNYTEALKYAQEGLSQKEHLEHEPDLYNITGSILDDLNRKDEALKILDEGIAKYPAFASLYFNKGIALMSLKRYAEAEEVYKKTLLISPYMSSAHFQLGIAALEQGKLMPAYLSFIGYLLINPQGKYVSNAITFLNNLSRSNDNALAYKNKRSTGAGDAYQEIEDIVLSKIALDPSYKPMVSIDDAISRQIQAVFEKMEYKNTDGDFWVQYYLPYFKQVFNQKRFEVFIFHIFSGVDLPVVQNYTKRNKKELEKFAEEAGNYFNLIRATRKLNYGERDTVALRFYFEDGALVSKGRMVDGKTFVGPWIIYYPGGNLRAAGNYTANGEKNGVWMYYHRNGDTRAKEFYKLGKIDGKQYYYYENGNLSSEDNYSNGVSEGLYTSYYYAGNKKLTVNYKQGKREGEQRQYYSSGALSEINNFTNDIFNGPSTLYYRNGKVKTLIPYVSGKVDGIYKGYHENGNISYEGRFTNDKAEGTWKYYYPSGKIKVISNYKSNLSDGASEEYFESGQLSLKSASKNGVPDGQSISYYDDGKVFCKSMYVNGVIKSRAFFDKAGALLHTVDLTGNNTSLPTFSYSGYRRSNTRFNSKGVVDGADTLYYPSGKIEQVNHYRDGQLNGLSITYYLNGKRKSEINKTDGEDDGYFTSFYVNGKPESEGWLVKGQRQGDWILYDEKGRVTNRLSYLNNELNGFKEVFNPNGKINLEEKYHLGWLEKVTQFDTVGNIIAVRVY
ncbi:hypothetical protein DJ568_07720 [Mucilaginibacter hurinus]|uniref:Uncharacterized protein n=1 Tax=Mucilaginibacter hurinus TaxID=2201324 RepID=A0A367GNK9_9SPHI|nr:tetratricopeptide repeat protein [Mucilaginibacter hurinus]RCH55074.1 hypothetical protein DJ568_07720 [Mucilaginibacter hurinus]